MWHYLLVNQKNRSLLAGFLLLFLNGFPDGCVADSEDSGGLPVA